MASMLTIREGVPRRQLGSQLGWFLLWLGTTAVAFYLSPNSAGHGTHQSLGLPPCPSVLAVGRPCPGCGLTTSFALTVRGSLGEAFQAHALGTFFYVLFSTAAFLGVWGFATRRSVELNRSWDRGILVLLIVFLGYGGIRFATHADYATPREEMMRGLWRR